MDTLIFHKGDNRISFKRYTFPGGLFTAEASTLEWPVGRVPQAFQVFVEASGNTKTFRYKGRQTDREGDVMWWIYKADEGTFEFRVFND